MSRLNELFDAWRDGAMDAESDQELQTLLTDSEQRQDWLQRCAEERQLREWAGHGVDAGACLRRDTDTIDGGGHGRVVWLLAAAVLIGVWLAWRGALGDPAPPKETNDSDLAVADDDRTTDQGATIDLLRWSFTDGRVQQSGALGEPIDLVGIDPNMFTDDGLRVRRDDFVRSPHIPELPPRPELRRRLADAAVVVLSARVRFSAAIPPNLSLATLSCRAAPPASRYAALRWLADPALATDGWHRVELRWQRQSGVKVCLIDGQERSRHEHSWPFAHWTDQIHVLLHKHEDGENSPLLVEYAELSIGTIE